MTGGAVASAGAAPARLALHIAQGSLFDTADALPPGLAFAPAFISAEAERQLIAMAAALPLREARYKAYTARRRVYAYGVPGQGGSRNGEASDEGRSDVDRERGNDGGSGGDDEARDGQSPQRLPLAALLPLLPLPQPLQALRAKLAAWAGVESGAFVQVMVAEYQRGTPLGWHRDAPQYGLIAGVSLGSPARLRLRPWPPRGGGSDDVIALELAPRSAYVMRDAARWGWQHSVPPVPALRYSVTMRTARR